MGGRESHRREGLTTKRSHVTTSSFTFLFHRLLLLFVRLPLCFQLLIPLHLRIMGSLHCLSLRVTLRFVPTFIFSAIFTRSAFSFTPSRGSFSAYNRRIPCNSPLLPSPGRSSFRSRPFPKRQSHRCSRASRAASSQLRCYVIRVKHKSYIGFRSFCSFCASRRS